MKFLKWLSQVGIVGVLVGALVTHYTGSPQVGAAVGNAAENAVDQAAEHYQEGE